jgi:hypothetical protein
MYMASWRTDMHEKTLPAPFITGYLWTFQELLGVSQLKAYYSWIAKEFFSDDPALKSTWIATMYQYFDAKIAQPLNYTFVSFIQYMIQKEFTGRDKGVIALTKKIGTTWWWSEPPISNYDDHTSLSVLLAPAILDQLHTEKRGFPHAPKSEAKSVRELASLGIETFVTQLHQQSGIDLSMQQNSTHIVVAMDVCPFCLNQSHLCYVFWGIVEGFLQWLHGYQQPNAIRPVYQIDQEASTGHSIALKFVEKDSLPAWKH